MDGIALKAGHDDAVSVPSDIKKMHNRVRLTNLVLSSSKSREWRCALWVLSQRRAAISACKKGQRWEMVFAKSAEMPER